MTMEGSGAASAGATDACPDDGVPRAAGPCESDPDSAEQPAAAERDARDNVAPAGRSLGRKISRRLSLVAKVPNLITVKLKQELGSRDSLSVALSLRKSKSNCGTPTSTPNGPPDLLRFTRSAKSRLLLISIIAPDKTQRIVS